MIVESTIVPWRSSRPCALKWALIVVNRSAARPSRSSKRRKLRMVVSSGSACSNVSFANWRSGAIRSAEHTSELQSLMRISYAVFCLKKKQIETLHEIQHSKYEHHALRPYN